MNKCNCNHLSAVKPADVATYTSVQDAVFAAADQAVAADCQGTFSVGGVMLDNNGNVLNAIHNNVVVDGMTSDPTAHGERQLIDWYYEQRAQNPDLPKPEDITIVTSLDPCCMCSGAILNGGFKVVSGAFDTESGIDYNTLANFPSLAPDLAVQAQQTFSYPEVAASTLGDNCFSRSATSAAVPAFFTDGLTIDNQTQALCSSVFEATLGSVQDKISIDVDPTDLVDLKLLSPDSDIVLALRNVYPQALDYTAPTRGAPDEGLGAYLISAAQQDLLNGGSGSSVALLDYFGNLLICLPGNEAVSPIQTPFMMVTRAYAQLRHQLYALYGATILNYLCHPKYGTFVVTLGQDKGTSSLIDLGAYGSTMEEALPADNLNSLQYVVPTISQSDLTAYCQNLPPLYSHDIGVYPTQVADQALIDYVTQNLPV